MKGLGNRSFQSVKGLTDTFSWLRKVEKNVLVLWFIRILKTVHLQQLKAMQSSTKGIWKEYHLLIEGIWMSAEGVPFPSKMIYICGASPYKTLLSTPLVKVKRNTTGIIEFLSMICNHYSPRCVVDCKELNTIISTKNQANLRHSVSDTGRGTARDLDTSKSLFKLA